MNIDEIEQVFGHTITFDGGSRVYIEEFYLLFSEAFPNPSYDKLMEIDGGKMGYANVFYKWKEEGIIS
jgi:hypothetical protein